MEVAHVVDASSRRATPRFPSGVCPYGASPKSRRAKHARRSRPGMSRSCISRCSRWLPDALEVVLPQRRTHDDVREQAQRAARRTCRATSGRPSSRRSRRRRRAARRCAPAACALRWPTASRTPSSSMSAVNAARPSRPTRIARRAAAPDQQKPGHRHYGVMRRPHRSPFGNVDFITRGNVNRGTGRSGGSCERSTPWRRRRLMTRPPAKNQRSRGRAGRAARRSSSPAGRRTRNRFTVCCSDA